MSHKQKYKSHLGAARQITAPNYLTEFILLRHAENRGIKLPLRVWDKKLYSKSLQWKYWNGLYYGELKRANALLKDFELNDILTALNTGEGKVILSLVNNKVRRLVKDACVARELKEKTKEKVEVKVVAPTTLPRKEYGPKSKRGKLL